MSKRFIIDEKNIDVIDNKITITGEQIHHINVLRYKISDRIYINKYDVEITELNNGYLKGIIVGLMKDKGIPKVNITLIQSYLKSDKMDYVVQKSVELGVKNIIPVISKNTVVKMEQKDRIKKKERLQKIAKEAVQQCGRTDEAKIDDIVELNKLDLSKYDKVIVCHELSNNKLKNIEEDLLNVKNIAVVIGPEGGFDEKEINDMCQFDNVCCILLGERILRAETASLNILSNLDYIFDN